MYHFADYTNNHWELTIDIFLDVLLVPGTGRGGIMILPEYVEQVGEWHQAWIKLYVHSLCVVTDTPKAELEDQSALHTLF